MPAAAPKSAKRSKTSTSEKSTASEGPHKEKQNGVRSLLIHEIQDLVSVEQQLIKALPKMMKLTSNARLKQAIEHHLQETQSQAERLREVCQMLGLTKEKAPRCEAMEAIIREGQKTANKASPAQVKDAAVISGAQRVEHYEMAGYGTAIALARLLEESSVADLLERSLEEEKSADRTLSQLAEGDVNPRAAQASGIEGGSQSGSQSSTSRSSSAGGQSGSLFGAQSTQHRSTSMPRDYDDRDDSRYFSRSSGGRGRRDQDDDHRGGSYEGRSRGGYASAQSQERDAYGQFAGHRGESSGSSRYSYRDDEDNGYSSSSRGRSSSRYDDDDRGGSNERGGSYEGRSRGGYASASNQERDEYGQFAGHRTGGSRSSSRYDDDRESSSSSRGSRWSSRDNDDDRGGSYERGSRGGRQDQERDEYGQYTSGRGGGRSTSSRYDDDNGYSSSSSRGRFSSRYDD